MPPSSGTDLSWKQTISLGWQKRQAVLNKVKNPKVETLEDKLSKMSRAELEEEYGDVIQAYKRFTNMGQGDTILAKWDMNDLKLLWKRYNEVKDDHLGLLPSELAKVDPKFKKRIDAMDQEAIEEAYPELKTLISMAHVNPYAQLFKSETERANYDYLLDRYFLLDSQKMLSWRDPAFQTKYDYYIIEEGINPFTGKPATQEEINRAKDIKKVRAFTDSLQLASTLYTSYVGYNQYYNKPYTTFSDVYSKVKGKVPAISIQRTTRSFNNTNTSMMFRKGADPLGEEFGPGRISNTKEWQIILDDLQNQGVEIVHREGVMGYSPAKGKPGQLVIDDNASYGALLHEKQHYLDDLKQGFPGMEYHFQTKNRLKMELNAYMEEIHLAESLGRKDIANSLFENYMSERNLLTNHLR